MRASLANSRTAAPLPEIEDEEKPEANANRQIARGLSRIAVCQGYVGKVVIFLALDDRLHAAELHVNIDATAIAIACRDLEDRDWDREQPVCNRCMLRG